MKRDPLKERLDAYYKSVHIKKIHPIIFWTKCDCCHQEFKNEVMYKCYYQDWFLDYTRCYIGCKECFESIEKFMDYIDNEVLIQRKFFEK